MSATPPTNGWYYRVENLERRIGRVEENGPKLIRVEAKVDGISEDLTRIDLNIKEQSEKFERRVTGLTRVLVALLVTITGSAVMLVLVMQSQ
jgi:hypothetical protein